MTNTKLYRLSYRLCVVPTPCCLRVANMHLQPYILYIRGWQLGRVDSTGIRFTFFYN